MTNRMTESEAAEKSAKARKAWKQPDTPLTHELAIIQGIVAGNKKAARKPKKRTAPAQVRGGSKGEQLLATQLRAAQIYGWQCEYRFLPPRRWRLDFAFIEFSLAIEVEGGAFSNGRHTRGKGFEADCEKYSALAIEGWRLIRCTPGQIKEGKALDWIRRALA